MITGWIGLESVLLPILITHQNSIWFWLLSRNFLLYFISVHSCITINETSVFITMEFSGWYIFYQDQNDEIQWRMLCRQKILKVWHPELLMKSLSQWQNFVFIMSDTNSHYSCVHLWNDYRAGDCLWCFLYKGPPLWLITDLIVNSPFKLLHISLYISWENLVLHQDNSF